MRHTAYRGDAVVAMRARIIMRSIADASYASRPHQKNGVDVRFPGGKTWLSVAVVVLGNNGEP